MLLAWPVGSRPEALNLGLGLRLEQGRRAGRVWGRGRGCPGWGRCASCFDTLLLEQGLCLRSKAGGAGLEGTGPSVNLWVPAGWPGEGPESRGCDPGQGFVTLSSLAAERWCWEGGLGCCPFHREVRSQGASVWSPLLDSVPQGQPPPTPSVLSYGFSQFNHHSAEAAAHSTS